ncbi:hypothetical protein [Amycolatopsis cihanbeyliensis]|uniref:Uncharacterized protein n=1 Tax=Amycolatopsis cihanbeyliensis TaxID=1128664 RepID=A0A542DKN5_AMYCI|nr:hypothetical protein [Amycolatopsis cihanbeyliensis]TQJ03662.1 hypothetical protein FB471_3426 [Amycolatopsis cihanbeyliensis]
MSSVLHTTRGWHRPLLVNTALMLSLVAVSIVGLLVDDRALLGEPVWVKPLKFGLSFAVYAATLAWLLGRLTRARRFGWWVGTVFAVVGVIEVGVVAFAAARGTFSHFNQSEEPANQAVQTIFNLGIPGIFVANLIIAIMVLFQRTGDRALTRAIRTGLAISTVGMFLAFWIVSVNVEDPRQVTDARGETMPMVGGHGVGTPDGGGLPILNWSTEGGDMRVPHFVGLHGIQVMLLLAIGLTALATRYVWLRDERTRARLVGVGAAGYSGLLAVVTWQAMRGQSLIHPDAATLTAFGTVVVLTGLALATVVAAGKRAAARSEEPALTR